jgi:recombination protein RecT
MTSAASTDQGGLRGRVAKRAEQAPPSTEVTRPQQPRSIYDLINMQKAEIARALPKHMDADRLARVIVTTLRQNPRLAECTPQSLLGALMLSAQLGLEPGPLGHAWFVPFWNKNVEWVDDEGRKKRGAYEVQWIIGYKGIIDLAQRSGKLLSIEAREVCRNDEFEFEYGLEPKLVHRPQIDGDRGEAFAYYGVAHFKDGGRYFLVMSKADVDKHKARSKSADNGPWQTDYDAMARKTVIRVMAPFLPLTVELAGAIAHDESVHRDVGEAMVEMPPPPRVIEGKVEHQAVDVDEQTGEITEATEGPEAAASSTDETPWPEDDQPAEGGAE